MVAVPDLDGDRTVGVPDLMILLTHWGPFDDEAWVVGRCRP